jgi:hypothetical protein
LPQRPRRVRNPANRRALQEETMNEFIGICLPG